MRTNEKAEAEFNVTDKFTKRALELLDESQAIQFVEALRLNRAASVVFAREEKRLRQKYGADDPRAKEMAVRSEASEEAKSELFTRYSDAMTPQPTVEKGWAVDGFVRTADGRTTDGLNVAAYDKNGNLHKEFGRGTTDARGYFSIKIEKFPEKPPAAIFMRASKGRTLLESNEVRLVPVEGASERVIIILTDRSGDKPEKPTQPEKPSASTTEKPRQPDKTSAAETEKPTQPDKPATATSAASAAAPGKLAVERIKPKASGSSASPRTGTRKSKASSKKGTAKSRTKRSTRKK